MEVENPIELLQRYRPDFRILLDFILFGSLIKKVILPPGTVTLDDVDLDQVSVDYVLNCVKKGGMLELSEAIRDYHDSIDMPQMNGNRLTDEFFLVTNPEYSGAPPKRAPPPIPVSSPAPVFAPSPDVSLSSVGHSESFNAAKVEDTEVPDVRELTVDDIEDFEDEDDIDEVNSVRISRRYN